MENIHPIDLKRRCVLLIGKKCLAESLKYLCYRHPDGEPLINPNDRFNKILSIDKNKLKHFKNNKISNIDDLDITGLCQIIDHIFPGLEGNEYVYCCDECVHGCDNNHPACSRSKKKVTVGCNKKPCTKCGKSCEAMEIQHCTFLLRMLRNMTDHIDDNKQYINLEQYKMPIKPFVNCRSWEEIWKIMNDAILGCLKILKGYNFIDDRVYKDHETDLWICLRKKKDDLWMLFGNHLKDLPTRDEIFDIFKKASIRMEGI